MASRKFFSIQNAHSSSSQQDQQQAQSSKHNGYQNVSMDLTFEPRYDSKVVVPEMAFFCFDVLHKELHGLDRHVEPSNLGICNMAL